MEHNKFEADIVEKVVTEATENQVRELNDLQLALIGGGIGDPVAA